MNSATHQMFGYSMKLTKMRDSYNKVVIRIQLFNRSGNELFANYLVLITTDGYKNDANILNDPSFINDCWSRVATIHDDQWEDVYNEFDRATKRFIESEAYGKIYWKVNDYFKIFK